VQGGYNPVLMNTGQMSGSQTIGKSSPANTTATTASLSLGYGNGFPLPTVSAGGSGSFCLSGAGALQPWYGGQQTSGLMNSTVTVNSTNSSGNPTYLIFNPTTGNLTSQIASGSGGYGPYITAVLAATPTSSGQTTTSIYQTFSPGTYKQTSSSPYSTGVYTNTSPLTGTMLLGGGSGSILSYPITANFNLTGTGASGAFPAVSSYSGTVTPNSFLGAVAGPSGGTQTGFAMGSANFSSDYGSSSMGLAGTFTLGPNTTTPPMQGTLTIGQGNTGTSPNGSPISVTGTWTQSDPPASGTQTTAGTSAAMSWGPNSRPLAWAIQRAAWLNSQSGDPSSPTGANASPWLNRFSRLTSAPLGSMIQQAAQLSRPGTPSVPGSGPDLHRLARPVSQRIQTATLTPYIR
jgi:hypothetical protein